jgi:transposase InsO family protein
VAHSDRGSQYTSLRYGERLAEAGITPSVGSVGDCLLTGYRSANVLVSPVMPRVNGGCVGWAGRATPVPCGRVELLVAA